MPAVPVSALPIWLGGGAAPFPQAIPAQIVDASGNAITPVIGGPNALVVSPSGTPYTSVVAALAAITNATAQNRYQIVVSGSILETGVVALKSHVDIIGLAGAQIVNANNDTSHTMSANAVVDALITDIAFVRNGVLTPGRQVNAGDITNGSSPTLRMVNVQFNNNTTGSTLCHGLHVADSSPTLASCQGYGSPGGANCYGYIETGNTFGLFSTGGNWYGGSGGNGCHGGAFQGLASGSHVASYFQGGGFGSGANCYGAITQNLSSSLFDACVFIGGGGSGTLNVGYGTTDGGSCHLMGCFCLGGNGGTFCYAGYVLGAGALMAASTEFVGGYGVGGRGIFAGDGSSVQLDGCSTGAHQALSTTFVNAATATDTLPPTQTTQAYTYIGGVMNVAVAHAGWTVKIGTAPGLGDIASGLSLTAIGAIGVTILAFPVIAANTPLYVTVTGGTPGAADYSFYLKAIAANVNSEALWLDTTGFVDVGVGKILSGPASDAVRVTAKTIAAAALNPNLFRVSGSSIIALQAPTAPKSSINLETAWSPSGFYDCTLIGAIGGSGGSLVIGAVTNTIPGRLQWTSDGPQYYNRSTAAAINILTTDHVILLNPTGGIFTVTLPTAVGAAGKVYILKNGTASTNAVTVATTGGQTIDGAATLVLNTAWAKTTLMSTGAQWVTV